MATEKSQFYYNFESHYNISWKVLKEHNYFSEQQLLSWHKGTSEPSNEDYQYCKVLLAYYFVNTMKRLKSDLEENGIDDYTFQTLSLDISYKEKLHEINRQIGYRLYSCPPSLWKRIGNTDSFLNKIIFNIELYLNDLEEKIQLINNNSNNSEENRKRRITILRKWKDSFENRLSSLRERIGLYNPQ